MKFVRFEQQNGQIGVGVADAGEFRVIDGETDLLPLIQQGEEALKTA